MGSPMKDRSKNSTVSTSVLRRTSQGSERTRDLLAAEEPLEIRLREEGGEAERFVVTMRTPGDDEDLSVGLLFGEGVIVSADEVVSVARPSDPRIDPDLARNVAVVTLRPDVTRRERTPRRATVIGSACGVCGRTSIDEVVALAARCRAGQSGGSVSPRPALLRVPSSLLVRLPGLLRSEQRGFEATGALHAAGLFEADGTLVLVREDVGRHNATDKAIGARLRAGKAAPPILVVSGRVGFEIAQKAALAGIAVVAAVSAPTSLAVEMADEAGLTLVGFLRGDTFNVYTHPERIAEA